VKPGRIRMRVERGGRRNIVLFGFGILLCLVAAATWAVAQQLRLSGVLYLAAAAAAASGIALASPLGNAFFNELRDRRGQRRDLASQLELDFRFVKGLSGCRVADKKDPYDLGVTRAAIRSEDAAGPVQASSGEPPPYIDRDVDMPGGAEAGKLETALTASNVVLLTGDSKAGKSRTAFEAMHRFFPKRLLLVPTHKAALPGLIKAKAVPGFDLKLPDSVIWLDDLEKWIGADGLTKNVFERLTSAPHGKVTVMATIRLEELAKLEIAKEVKQLVPPNCVVDLERKLSPGELSRAETKRSDPRIAAALRESDRYGLAEYLAAGPELVERLRAGRNGTPVGYAIVRAAVDWRRAGLQRAVTGGALQMLYPIYLLDARPSQFDSETFHAGLNWATERICGTAALLDEDQTGGYRAFDYIVDHFEHEARSGRDPVRLESWDILLGQVANPQEAYEIGREAYFATQPQIAERAWLVAAQGGHAEAAFNLGQLLEKSDRSPEAWYRQAAQARHAEAAFELGRVLRAADHKEEAEVWLRQAATDGHVKACSALGLLLEESDRKKEAEPWYHQAALAGDAECALRLGVLVKELGRAPEAEQWLLQAAETGNADAAYELGTLLRQLRRWDDGELWLQKAAEAGHLDAAIYQGQKWWIHGLNHTAWAEPKYLGVILNNAIDSESWFRKAAEAGSADGAFELAKLLEHLSNRGDQPWLRKTAHTSGANWKTEADGWYLRAAEAGSAEAALLLARRARPGTKSGLTDVKKAEAWYRQAAQSGNSEAAFELWQLLEQDGRNAEAEPWLRQAAKAGHAKAALKLGMVLCGRDRKAEAEPWLRQAAEARDLHAAFELGALLEELDRKDEAEPWFRMAAHDDSDVAYKLGVYLGLRYRRPEAEAWYRRATWPGPPPPGTAWADPTNRVVFQQGLVKGLQQQLAVAEVKLRQTAQTGDAAAAYELGQLLVELDRKSDAEPWYRQAAEAGDSTAAYELGRLLEWLDRKSEAEPWYRQAAEAGHPMAAFELRLFGRRTDQLT
jgi:TPR repeat protein